MGAAFLISFSPVDAYSLQMGTPGGTPSSGLTRSVSHSYSLSLTLSLDFQPLNCIADDLPNCVYLLKEPTA